MKYAAFALLAAMVSDVSAQAYVSPDKRYTTPGGLPECHGNNGPLGINCVAPPCSGTNGPKDGPTGTPCLQDEPADIPHYNTGAAASPAPYEGGNMTPGSGKQPITAAYFPDNYPAVLVQVPEPQPIGTLMAQLNARSME